MVDLAVVLENHSYANGEFNLVASNEFRESKLKHLIKQKTVPQPFLTIPKKEKKKKKTKTKTRNYMLQAVRVGHQNAK